MRMESLPIRILDMRPAGGRRGPKAWILPLAVAGLLAPLGGCGPAPPTSAELGRVVFDAEEMPGGHKRFLLPDAKGGPGEEDHGGPGHDHAGHPPHEDSAEGKNRGENE
jgi:hypothetical protein